MALPVRERTAYPPIAAKVPEITALFWVLKLVTTFMGEVTSDYLLTGVDMALGAVVEVLLILAALAVQFRARRYVAAAYWFLAMAIAVFGTGAADALHVLLGIPYTGTVALWAAVLALVLWRWQRSEGTLSIHSITTRRRERYYWGTVFATFALGTALGDFMPAVLHLGYLPSGVLFGVLILIPAVAWRYLGLNAITGFWSAYIVTRPLGATFADYLSRSHANGGLGFGTAATSAASALLLVLLVTYVSASRRDAQAAEAALPALADGSGRGARSRPRGGRPDEEGGSGQQPEVECDPAVRAGEVHGDRADLQQQEPDRRGRGEAGDDAGQGRQDESGRAEHLDRAQRSDGGQRYPVDPGHHRAEPVSAADRLHRARVEVEEGEQCGDGPVGEAHDSAAFGDPAGSVA